ncbi:exonuclease subunit SbcD [Zunongwangia endophytica]|uniref:Nuclease SbcCD subunit D n=1 Tax=Zunongwangia endophytica TaxID=1808945 RepID=A0ABV8HBS3_9FLAO|nr:exonuclease SbcCD subunit D C-terminal domain-containing protein [Zunongwangia endophytica]MDN3593526.1 exonuclease SbcCD subunit D C-terminal domain-containing protein [Zunongwangia endophytica]
MKILHTADWHIGKKLHKHDLFADFELFIDWLCQLITEEEIALLLISGDIFDLANPSSDARKQYYQALIKLQKLDCKIVATGGNHDSPAMLDAPKEILRELDISIIGGLPEKLEDTIIPVFNAEEKVELVIAAIPFLRDADLRSANEGITYEDRIEAIRNGIEHTFKNAAEICQDQFPDVPAIAMGHLFAAGIETSDSERDIQIGNQAAFSASQFGNFFNYVALGHIHKPQRVSAEIPVFYSGSPIPLSFSERKDDKRILILDSANSWEPKSVNVPNFRKLLRITGDLNEIEFKLNTLEDHDHLDHLIEVDLLEEQYDAQKIYALDVLVNSFNKPGYEIVKQRAEFKNKLKGTAELYAQSQQLQDLKPTDVFSELITTHDYDEATKNEIWSAFNEILEEIHQSDNTAE